MRALVMSGQVRFEDEVVAARVKGASGEEQTTVVARLAVPEAEIIDAEWRVVPRRARGVRLFLGQLFGRLEQLLAFSLAILFGVGWLVGMIGTAAFFLMLLLRG